MRPTPVVIALVVALLAAGHEPAAADPGTRCSAAAAHQLRACLRRVHAASRRCFADGNRACLGADFRFVRALGELEARVRGKCGEPGAVAGAGHGPLLDADALAARLRATCAGDDASLVARTFGGPKGVVFEAADTAGRACLAAAAAEAARLEDRAFRLRSRCTKRVRHGRPCDVTEVEERIDAAAAKTTAALTALCPDLRALVALDVPEYVARLRAQERCLVPAVFGSSGPFDLDCGPRPSVPVPARAAPTRVILDEAVWGTRCGDGSAYAFWLQLAPEGAPADRVVVYMQGGGVCIADDDCSGVSSGLFRALDNTQATGGILSSTSTSNPYRDWTKIYLPYCTQDLHIGGGRANVFPSVTVERYGGVNVRAALRYVRDVLWGDLDATSPAGYRPDEVRAIFSGGSAGAFGAAYNYHWVLDDLRWPRTTAVPDAGLGLSNGSINGVAGIGILITSDGAWGARSLLPPYCDERICAVVPRLEQATSHRLEAFPEQRIVNVSNQVDTTQSATTRFPNLTSWIDALRTSYCQMQGMPGIHYFLSAIPSHRHTLMASSNFTSTTSVGEPLNVYLGGLIDAPAAITDRVEEGDLAAIYGAIPFPCTLGTP